jgi:hypothetical protein
VLRLLVLQLRHRVGHDPGAGLDVGHAVLDDRCPDGDRRVEVAGEVEVADDAAVHAPPQPS